MLIAIPWEVMEEDKFFSLKFCSVDGSHVLWIFIYDISAQKIRLY